MSYYFFIPCAFIIIFMQFPFSVLEKTDFDAVGFGTNAVDFLIRVPEYPAYASKIELADYIQAAGGEVATTMSGLQRLGMKTAYAGRFGDDDAGSFGIETLRKEGVDVRFAEVVTGASTQIAFIVIDIRSGERTVIWKRDAKLSYTPDEADLNLVNSTKILHMTPHDAYACTRLAEAAQEAGTIVSLDIDNIFDGVEDLLRRTDILIASTELAEKMFGVTGAKAALKEFQSRYGSAIVGVTLGEKGSLLLCNDTFIETEGYAVPGGCMDTTGAGDAFRVGLLYGLLTGESVEVSAKMANAAAALKCREIGARTALPNKDELNDLITS